MAVLLRHTLMEAHNESGRFDALQIAKTLSFSTQEMASILGYTPRGIQKNPDSVRLQEKLGELVSLVLRLRALFNGSMKHVRIWLRARHPDLENLSPVQAMEQHGLEVVATLVHLIETGQPS
jgi:hypothetical protein